MATLKTELINRHSLKTRDEARLAVFSYIEGFYNSVKRHSSLEFEKMAAARDPQTAGV